MSVAALPIGLAFQCWMVLKLAETIDTVVDLSSWSTRKKCLETPYFPSPIPMGYHLKEDIQAENTSQYCRANQPSCYDLGSKTNKSIIGG
mmetsp:Transcript_10024/g.23887  ORF Transcript_10024/g.23887 Transcript_10024/m.23887 type:complete len:90 (+) Transcript_10024:884-1153(+)